MASMREEMQQKDMSVGAGAPPIASSAEVPAASHTPGPWEVGTEGNGTPGYVYCSNALGSAVAVVYVPGFAYTAFSRAEEEANARLIAAAPDLLDACTAAPILSKYHGPGGFMLEQFCADYLNWKDAVRAAIAKATSPSPTA